MSQVLQTLYASAPTNDFPIHTLELSHNAFNDGVIRLCQGFDDIEAKLETGEQVGFMASGFAVSLPKRSLRGQQDLQFQLDNVSGEAAQQVDAALDAGGKITVTYRVYLASNLSEPAQAPVVMTAKTVKITISSVVVVASFHDLVNKAWPRRRYTTAFAPGLKYIS
ncbi:DUF1833 family protein [Shewanella surugensis]|uniref:DUF1833 domain-containing protein n=1 Tax=Shewanella surugensis TaxID=212020 RepID=A0ABT0L7D8_9GAMM|nr:DUF1833 family protein [Shewanella surugensis]MCL1123607.1 DUF1833 domain-containing protein [Shewanella surugensis]